MAKKDVLVHLDLNNNQLLNASLQNLATHPSTSGKTAGWIYWNTADETVYVYTGGTNPVWIDLYELYQHPDYSAAVNAADPALTGATVISRVTITNGHVTGIQTRDLTPGDIGAAGISHTHSYTDIKSVPANTLLGNNTGTAGDVVAVTPAQILVMLGIAYGSLALLNTGTSTQQSTFTPKDISDFVTAKLNALTTVSNLSLGTRTTTTVPINNSNGTGVTIPAATTSLAGVMTSADKTKLDGVEAGANNYTHPTHTTSNDFSTAITSGLDVLGKVSVAANGHVTEIAKRTITAADIAAVIFNNAVNNGTVTTWTSTKIYNEIQAAINQAQTGALQYKGEYNAGTSLPALTTDTTIKIGYTYVVVGTGTFAGQAVEAGDMIIAKADNPGSTAGNWQIVNKNIPAIVSASTTVQGIIQLATQAEVDAGTNALKAVTPATLKAHLDARTGGYSANFGDGATTNFTITHNLNSQDVVIQIQRVSDRKEVIMETASPTANTVTVGCNVAPTANQYRVIIKK